MQLSFYARGDVLVAVPGQTRPVGTGIEMVSGPPVRYVARDWVAPVNYRRTREGIKVDEPAKYVASAEPFRCDSDSYVGQRMVRHMSRPRCRRTGDYPLWPADKATADFLGLPFVEVEIRDGDAVPVTKTSRTHKAPSAGKVAD
jgi:hypothetical protein